MASWLGAPTVIGAFLAVVIISYCLGSWVESNNVIHIIAEIGVILMFLEVGLETEMGNFLFAGKTAGGDVF